MTTLSTTLRQFALASFAISLAVVGYTVVAGAALKDTQPNLKTERT
jgi:hypothetical protein